MGFKGDNLLKQIFIESNAFSCFAPLSFLFPQTPTKFLS